MNAHVTRRLRQRGRHFCVSETASDPTGAGPRAQSLSMTPICLKDPGSQLRGSLIDGKMPGHDPCVTRSLNPALTLMPESRPPKPCARPFRHSYFHLLGPEDFRPFEGEKDTKIEKSPVPNTETGSNESFPGAHSPLQKCPRPAQTGGRGARTLAVKSTAAPRFRRSVATLTLP